MAVKRLLCFGDSNTWGYIPGTEPLTRYGEDIRWTSLLQKKMGKDCTVIEFGLCGCQTGGKKEGKFFNTNAQILYPSVLFASMPLDAVFIMLGTNDLKKENEWQPGETAKNLGRLIQLSRAFAPHLKIFLAPAVILQEGIKNDPDFEPVSAIANSKICAGETVELAQNLNLPLFDTNSYIKQLDYDGCHFTAESHKIFAEELAHFFAIHFSESGV